ncbi:hypothetical protein [Aliiroseovarius sp.]|uniref:hypothetical protein n=1 Tax=Aliiroseovarius sp. TaxID=1872442 RepID=UPI003BACB469
MGLVRLLVFGFIGLTVVYFAVSIYSRSVRREKLENQWAEDHPGDTESAERDAFVEAGMAEYNAGIRPKLILLVYVVPLLAGALLLYLINFV